jgi:predicted PurR-regulated permease PerM
MDKSPEFLRAGRRKTPGTRVGRLFHGRSQVEVVCRADFSQGIAILNSDSLSNPAATSSIRSIAISLIAFLAVFYTLHVARAVLIPVAVAMLLNLLLAPLVARLRRIGIPAAISSAVILLALLAGLTFTINSLIDPAREWIQDAPTSLRQLSREFEDVKQPFEEAKKLGEEVGEITKLDSRGPKAQEVEIRESNGLEKLVESIPTFLTSVAITFLTAFFLLAAGDDLARKVIGFGRSWKEKSRIIRVCRQMQEQVSRHLRTITLINLTLGFVVGLALYFLNVPNPELWGTMVALFNFAPYVGAIVSTLVLTVVGVTTSDTMTGALLIPGIFVVLTSLEGAVITPLILGRRLNLSSLVVFLSVVFWGWLWGVTGALIAVPIVSSIQVALANLDSTRSIAGLMEN